MRYAVDWEATRFAKVDDDVSAVIVPRLDVDIIVLVIDVLLC